MWTVTLKELNSERRWQKTFADSQNALTKLADEALAEHSAGESQNLDPNQLWSLEQQNVFEKRWVPVAEYSMPQFLQAGKSNLPKSLQKKTLSF